MKMNWEELKERLLKSNHHYFHTNNGVLLCGDCIEVMKEIPEKSIDLVLTDPPYGMNKDKWDLFSKEDEYIDFMLSFIKEVERVMKTNATFYFFHIDIEAISEIVIRIKGETKLKFVQFIVWNKRFDGSKNKAYLDGFLQVKNLNTFPTMAEYILKYRKDIGKILREKREQLNIPQSVISKELPSKSGKITGWYSNIETGKYLPNEKTIKPIQKYLGFKLEELTPIFNNQKTHHSVWNYDFEQKQYGHLTPKPLALIENILIHSSNKHSIVLDSFLGSGTTAIACEKLSRRWIGIEINPEYCEITKQRIIKCLKEKECLK